MGRRTRVLLRGVGLGLASGILSTAASTVVILSTPADALPPRLRSPWVRRVAVAAAMAEVFGNAAISSLPARTQPAPLAGRAGMGMLAGALLPAPYGSSRLVAALAGGIAAPFSAWFATTSRAAIVPPVPDVLVAGIETVCSYSLARVATRR